MNTYGVCNHNGEYNDVSKTLLGAKQYATRNGYNVVYMRFNGSYDVITESIKKSGNWYDIDDRYTINSECCGYIAPRYVVRFCDKYLSNHKTLASSYKAAHKHNKKRF